jgi:hypothetical protein
LYTLLQEILTDNFGDDVDFVYEPFLWDHRCFNGKYADVSENFRYINSLSIEGMFHHQEIPIFLDNPGKYKGNPYLNAILNGSSKCCLLMKSIRANGRYKLLKSISPDTKFIFLIRNPIDVVNSSIIRFSFYGNEFHKDDWNRFAAEVNLHYGKKIGTNSFGSQIEKEVLYWYYANKFAVESFKQCKNPPLFICYEDYISNRNLWVNKICSYIEIPAANNFYEYSHIAGSSRTTTVNISKSEFQILNTYMKKYEDLLRNGGVSVIPDFEKIFEKYKNFPEIVPGRSLFPGKTTIYINSMYLELKREIAHRAS